MDMERTAGNRQRILQNMQEQERQGGQRGRLDETSSMSLLVVTLAFIL